MDLFDDYIDIVTNLDDFEYQFIYTRYEKEK